MVLAAAWTLLFLVPRLAGDPLPPEISFSQFGLGPNGWLFSVWAMLLPAVLALLMAGSDPPRAAVVLWWLGTIGCLVMAVVPTDEGGLQASPNARVHMVGSVLALFGIPYACLVLLWARRRAARVAGIALAFVHTLSIALLLLAAAGWDTAGLGPAASWAWWQFVAIIADHLLATGVAFATAARTFGACRTSSIQ